ncbi:MAG: Na+/H+ antiporter subunit E [Chromatiales bacterium]|nr:Na+/H+ antiporter subunit E [Chromatiales bacterium]
MFYAASAGLALYAFWLLLSGHFEAFLLSAGAASALAVAWLSHRMDLIDREGHPVHLGPRALLYWPWLLAEIVRSAWDVSRIIVHPRLPISPTLVRFRPSQRTDLGRVILANSITLTPGTITIEASAEEFLVHALTEAGADALATGDMDRRVTGFEGSP